MLQDRDTWGTFWQVYVYMLTPGRGVNAALKLKSRLIPLLSTLTATGQGSVKRLLSFLSTEKTHWLLQLRGIIHFCQEEGWRGDDMGHLTWLYYSQDLKDRTCLRKWLLCLSGCVCASVSADMKTKGWVVLSLTDLDMCDWLCVHIEYCGRTWFPGGDGGAWWGWPGAGAVVCQNSNMVSRAGSKSRHSGRCFQSRCPHSVCCRFPFMLPPVPDLRTHSTSRDIYKPSLKNCTWHASL